MIRLERNYLHSKHRLYLALQPLNSKRTFQDKKDFDFVLKAETDVNDNRNNIIGMKSSMFPLTPHFKGSYEDVKSKHLFS